MTNTLAVSEIYGVQEAQQMEDYINNFYSKKVPPPIKPTEEDLSFWKISGFETLSFFIPSIAFAIFSAIRTSGFFFVQEQTLLRKYNIPEEFIWFLSLIVMITGIFGFEGILLAAGIKRGRNQNENEEQKWSTYLSTSVIIGIGIYIGINMLDVPDDVMLYINVGMALLTGIGGGIITYFGGNDIGYALSKFDRTRLDVQENYQDQYNHWRESAIQSYISAKKQVAKISGIQQPTLQELTNKQPEVMNKKRTKVEIAYDFIKEYYLENKYLPIIQLVSDSTGVANGTCQPAMENFKLDNEEELLQNKVVTFEEIEKIKTRKFEKDPKYKELVAFVRENQRFPSESEIVAMEIPVSTLYQFIKFEESTIRENGWLSDETIQQALSSQN